MYKNSLTKALKTIYPSLPWAEWRFASVPKVFWEDMENQKKFGKWVEKELGMKSADDWIHVDTQKLRDLGASGMLIFYSLSLACC